MINEKTRKINEKGQTLLFVVVAVTIALAVGASISSRTLNSLRRVSRSDTSSRVMAAAEGGIENLLKHNYASLELAMTPSEVNCSAVGASFISSKNTCVYVFSGSPDQKNCDCGSWVKSTECGTDGCSNQQKYETRVCSPDGCDEQARCVNESELSCPTQAQCTCDSWKPVFRCGTDGCSSTQIYMTRSCSPNNCDTQSRCVTDPSCESGACTCTGWADFPACGTDGCSSIQRYMTRICTPIRCQEESRCVYDPGCKILGASDVKDDTVSSRAIVKVERFSTNEDSGGYSFSIDPDMVKEVSLVGYGSSSINVCWENINSAIYYYSYNQDGDVVKGGTYNLGISVNGSMLGDFDSSLGSAVGSFPYCKSVNLVSNPYGLRIRVLYNSSKVAVFPDGGSSLPEQGYKFTSIGELTSSDSIDETVTVIVHKSFPYASPIFDYGIYTPQMLQ